MSDIPTRAHQELDPDDHIIVMCHHGVRSLSVTNWFASRDMRTFNPCVAASTAGHAPWTQRFRCIEREPLAG